MNYNVKRILSYVFKYKAKVSVSIICMLIYSVFNAVSIYTVKPIIDKIFVSTGLAVSITIPYMNKTIEMSRFSLLLWISALLIGVFFIKGIASYFQVYLMAYVGMKSANDLRNDMYKKMLSFSMDFYDSRKTGDLMSRLINDINIVQTAVANAVTTAVKDPFVIITLLALMFYLDWRLTIASLFASPLIAYLISYFGRKTRTITGSMQRSLSAVASFLHETLAAVKIIKIFNREDDELRKYYGKTENYLKQTMKIVKIKALIAPVLELISAFGVAAIVIYGGLSVIRSIETGGESGITAGTFFAFVATLISIYKPARSLTQLNNTWQQILAVSDRIFGVMDIEPAVKEKQTALTSFDFKDEIKYKSVHFKYKNNYVLEDINLRVKKGEKIAFVGSSGSGKSTLVNLLPRFYEINKGDITIDGISIQDLSVAALRSKIAVVTQETILFNDTVYNNIAYGNPEAGEKEVIKAAEIANAHNFIMSIKDNYYTKIGEKGIRLSGGERQRITLARAVIKNPDILILDEATSALDTESEKMVERAMEKVMENRTTLVIAHRLSTVINADRIIVLKEGKIVEEGKHSELLNKNGVYKYFYELQFKN